MTHSLHRFGNRENLSNDYVVVARTAKGINEEGLGPMIRKFVELALELDPVNAGDYTAGTLLTHSRQELLDGINDQSRVQVVFSDQEKVTSFLKRLREVDLGVSVVVTGLFDRVRECAQSAGLSEPHTVQCSCGMWGRVEQLPDAQIMQVTTMCGHAQISASQVERRARDVRAGRMTAEEAALDLARPCVCGIFNPVRAAGLIEAMASGTGKTGSVVAGQTSA
jgi:hypothetical protein